ncbi:MAG: 16S rRNA (cytosine(1402)-N(4))-methyltransferase RsmH [Mycoplasma sp.]|nr:16S rRNA (cytosine(1402)-N(4))-methyltransferase RsmH [Mycoplasma sp.]
MHVPVMLNEVIQSLDIKQDGIYVDLTLGRAGHSEAILKNIKNGKLIAFDKDKIAINESWSRLIKVSDNFVLIHSDFKNIKDELGKLGIKKVDGIIADLGVSSPQLDNKDRGFSYNKDGYLDMRMDQDQSLKAWDIVNNWSAEELIDIFTSYADVKLPKVIANAIIENRPINSTLQLVDIIKSCLPAKIIRQKNPAKTVFQAIRIAVNNELESLGTVLKDSIDFLNDGGVLAIITFHSIEDKIVKEFFGKLIKSKIDPKIPIQEEKKFFVKTIYPTKDEIQSNKRSRSAKLRVLKKI